MEPGRLVTYKDYTIGIDYVEFLDETDDPREWSPLGTMTCFHGRYKLGDDHDWTVEEFKDWFKQHENKLISLPLYLYDHSGISMSTSTSYPFNCPWDAGQVGYIYIHEDEAKAYFGNVKALTDEHRKEMVGYLVSEVETYDQYLRGDVLMFTITSPEGKTVDSCSGIYDDVETLIRDCKGTVEWHIAKRFKELRETAIRTWNTGDFTVR